MVCYVTSVKMSIIRVLSENFPGDVILPQNMEAIPKDVYTVYILALNGNAIVVGHGRRDRARVIFDGLGQTTVHFKALLVRIYHLYSPVGANFQRFLVSCANKQEALVRERRLHALIGGNNPQIPLELSQALFQGLAVGSVPWVLLKAAQASSYDGLTDLRKWRDLGIIKDADWAIITGKLGQF